MSEELAIYLAGSFRNQALYRHYAATLSAHGFRVTSRWLYEDAVNDPAAKAAQRDPKAGVSFARADLEDIRAANVFICFTGAPSMTGGFHTEFGYALSINLALVVVGPVLNIFQALPAIQVFPEWGPAVLDYLADLEPVQKGRFN